MQSQSQLNQDIDVINFFNHKRDGYFVEIGANDGIFLSNTYLLEKSYNWKGICVEPIPEMFEKLETNRPESICIKKAIYNESSLILKFNIARDTLFSGLINHVDRHVNSLQGGNVIDVETISMNDLLLQNNAPNFIEYLSLDTEGSEYEILKTIDYNAYTFGVIHVEHNFIEPRRTEMRNFLISKGYIYKRQNKWDDEYIHQSMMSA